MDPAIAVRSMRDDPAIFDDPRVIENILRLDAVYQPSASYFDDVQVDVRPPMRKILLSWMSEVSFICPVAVSSAFLTHVLLCFA